MIRVHSLACRVKKTSLGLGFGLLIVSAIGGLSYWSFTRLLSAADWVTHTHQVLENLNELLSHVKEAETGQQGYLLTGDLKYLEPYYTAIKEVDPEIQMLRQLTANNPSQQSRLDKLEPLIASKLTELQETITLRQTKGKDVAKQVILRQRGQILMQEIRQIIRQMENEEQQTLLSGQAAAAQNAQVTMSVIISGIVLAFILVPVAIVIVQSSASQRQQALSALLQAKDELERRVAERTQELQQANERLSIELSDRVVTEAALRRSEEKYRDLFENASDLIQSVTIDGCFVYVNHVCQETLGYSAAEFAGMQVLEIIHPDSQAHWMEIFQQVLAGEKIDRLKTEFITKDGQKISVEGSINCKFVDGKPVATRAIFRDITARLQAEEALRYQQEQTERLLLNLLPKPIADRLKQNQSTIAENFADVSVMFADIVGFTELSARISPIELVEILNVIFSEFDQLAEQHGLEKIKTIGDAYMVVGGVPSPQQNHAHAIAQMALDMQATIAEFSEETGQSLSIRVGINTGPVVAGVIGTKKFIYDLWGDTVNIASRMESHGLPGQIQVTQTTEERLRDQFLFEERGAIDVKGKGKMTTYLLLGKKVRSLSLLPLSTNSPT